MPSAEEDFIEHLESENARLQRDHDLMLANLTATQARCTELLEEVRRLRTRVDACENCARCGKKTERPYDVCNICIGEINER